MAIWNSKSHLRILKCDLAKVPLEDCRAAPAAREPDQDRHGPVSRDCSRLRPVLGARTICSTECECPGNLSKEAVRGRFDVRVAGRYAPSPALPGRAMGIRRPGLHKGGSWRQGPLGAVRVPQDGKELRRACLEAPYLAPGPDCQGQDGGKKDENLGRRKFWREKPATSASFSTAAT